VPLVQVTMVEGRSPEQKRALLEKLTDAVVETLGAKRETVRVILYEVPKAHWGVGGVSKAEQDAARGESP